MKELEIEAGGYVCTARLRRNDEADYSRAAGQLVHGEIAPDELSAQERHDLDANDRICRIFRPADFAAEYQLIVSGVQAAKGPMQHIALTLSPADPNGAIRRVRTYRRFGQLREQRQRGSG